jgi:DNA-binding MarR family transcriptional regulator
MSRTTKSDLTEAIGFTVSRWQDATQAFDEKFGERFHLNASERRCLAFLSSGPKSAKDIAAETKLTPAAITALLDRLERRGLLKRLPDSLDRRKILVAMTDEASRIAHEAYGPIVEAGAAFLEGFSVDELRTILRFVEGVRDLQHRRISEV